MRPSVAEARRQNIEQARATRAARTAKAAKAKKRIVKTKTRKT
jgi:hypothetical protein